MYGMYDFNILSVKFSNIKYNQIITEFPNFFMILNRNSYLDLHFLPNLQSLVASNLLSKSMNFPIILPYICQIQQKHNLFICNHNVKPNDLIL